MRKTCRKLVSAVIGMSMLAGVLSGCGATGAGESSAATEASGAGAADTSESASEEGGEAAETSEDSGKNKLAYFFPLTGDQMQYGLMLQRGSELALDLYNEEHGTSYVAEFHDDKGDATEAVNVANKIVADWEAIPPPALWLRLRFLKRLRCFCSVPTRPTLISRPWATSCFPV